MRMSCDPDYPGPALADSGRFRSRSTTERNNLFACFLRQPLVLSLLLMKPIPFIVIALMAFSSCTFDKANDAPSAPPINDSVAISYKNDIVPIMITYCDGKGYPNNTSQQLCHVSNTNQGSNGDFTNYQGLKDKVDNGSIASRVFNSNGGMPPTYSQTPTSLTDSDLQKLELWVTQGALDN